MRLPVTSDVLSEHQAAVGKLLLSVHNNPRKRLYWISK
jgi:hypothetical protein